MSKFHHKKAIITLSCALSVSGLMPVWSADEASSLDSMWIDQEAPTIDNDNASKNTNSAAVASTTGVPSTVAPMCAFEEFRQSQFVTKATWPGLGPFKASSNDISDLTDEKQNHVKLSVRSEQVTSAQLGLGKLGSGNVKDVLDIEMAADFLLEALGAKPRRIAEFNKELEKLKGKLKPGAGVNLAAGRYQVVIDRSKSAQPYSCLIAVNSLDANKTTIAEHSVKQPDENQQPDEVAVEPKPEVKHPIINAIKKPMTIPNVIKPKSTQPAISPNIDQKKEDFVATIKSWQQIKKVAIRKRDTSHLAEILTGTALKKQTTAVQWLQTNGTYYEMEPKGCTVQKYTDLGTGTKFAVVAEVREYSKYIKEADNSVIKEQDDKYTVNYTMEKVNGKWLIADSALLTNNGPTKNPPKR